MGSDLHSDKQDKQLKLQARKKELEQLLAAKNEELYKLCVQEVQLTGVMPPEAPLSPDVPQRERLGSVRSIDKTSEGDDVRDGVDNTSRRHRVISGDSDLRKTISHRLSTPSISGVSTKSGHPRHVRRNETTCSNYFPSSPLERSPETFSIQTSHTYPTLPNRHDKTPPEVHNDQQPSPVYRHHTLTTDYMNKMYYNNAPESHNVSRLRETHFSSSHPDIATQYAQNTVTTHSVPQNYMRNTPLLYHYASQLKAQNQHLGTLAHHHQLPLQPKRRSDGTRRNTLQRTQTYHLTSHSDYNQHLENMTDAYRPPLPVHQHRSQTDIQERDHRSDRIHIPERVVPNTLPLRERNLRHPMHMQLQVSTDDFIRDDRRAFHETLSPISQVSGYTQSNFDSVSMNKFSPVSNAEVKVKEKHWYETSLDSPTKSEVSPIKTSSLKRTSSIGNSQAYEIMVSSGRHSALQSPNQIPISPPVLSTSGVSLESPKNLTIIEQGKYIPYREETKPFEMADFYKYSTKFRQANAQKVSNTIPANVNVGYNKLPAELPQYAQENWHSQNQ
ncbi:hypothetical protein EVAR_12109_1 [Eumeta japonica]|uniref:Cytohesin Ubiquitin Protein Inducing domain-containing protein n=1 Tax=Eumeta variegata TaxID=151549 RepID=A0A4C1U5G7_EUMVA|nr:hypothetical protein EVAR_12109_1 [Eumeta japonica]